MHESILDNLKKNYIMIPKTLVNRWETRCKRYWIETYSDNTYRRNNGGGSRRTASKLKQMVLELIAIAKQIDGINYKLVH